MIPLRDRAWGYLRLPQLHEDVHVARRRNHVPRPK
jgi:hypothetical protein